MVDKKVLPKKNCTKLMKFCILSFKVMIKWTYTLMKLTQSGQMKTGIIKRKKKLDFVDEIVK